MMNAFGSSNMRDVSDNRALRFIARIQCDWWLPFQAIINRLFEEGYINVNQYDKLYAIDCRNEDGIYRKLLKNIEQLPNRECFMIANQFHMDGLRIPRQNLYGTLAKYSNGREAMEDPIFYSMALEIIE